MAKQDWINVWIDKFGDGSGQSYLIFSKQLDFARASGETVTIQETAQSGSVIIETFTEPARPDEVATTITQAGPVPQSVTSYGDAEVYLSIRQGRTARFLSGPVHTPLKIKNVNSMSLIILAPLPVPLKGTKFIYRTNLNGHCTFQVGSKVDYTFRPQEEGLGGVYWASMLKSGSLSEVKLD